jgi:NAD-dependent DNA ligase
VGESTAKLFSKHYANIRDLLNDANRGVLIALPDVGVVTQTSVAEFGESNRAFLESLDTVGVTPLQQR